MFPDTFYYSLHDPVPLSTSAKPRPKAEFEKFVDPYALFGAPAESRAGAHPDLSIGMVLRTGTLLGEILDGLETPAETTIELPPGLFADLGEVPACPADAFERTTSANGAPDGCPADSQVGVVGALFGGKVPDRTFPLYKLEPSPGHLAALGFPYELLSRRVPMVMTVDLRAGDYGLDLTRQTPSDFNDFLPAPFMTIWGVPGDPAHDAERMNPDGWRWGAALPGPHPPLIGRVADCGAEPADARLRLLYVDEAGRLALPGAGEEPIYRHFEPGQTGCEALTFDPGLDVALSDDRADSSTGVEVRLRLPQAQAGGGPVATALSEATLALPAGMSLNPAAIEGMVGCTPSQIGLEGTGFPSPEPIRFSPGPASCPAASKLGSVVVETPLTEEPLDGAVYLAKPFENPFRSRWALYLAVDGPGFTVKLPARVEVAPDSGRVSVTVDSLPKLPLEGVTLDLPDAPDSALSTPAACGPRSAQARLVPWSTSPSPAVVDQSLGFEPVVAGQECDGERPRPFAPRLLASTGSDAAAASSSLRLRLERPAGDQSLKQISVTLPRGLVASLRDRPRCGEGEIATARERSVPGGGVVERARPSCPAGSRVGSLVAATGTGPAPLLSHGSVYLAGPYEQAPYSLVAITPAVAGGDGEPLVDLGTVVDRLALRLDPRTARIELESDPLPDLLAGIPLRIDALTLDLDADGFLRNPTGCDEKRLSAEVEGGEGSRADLVAGLQVTGCEGLRFRPGLKVRSTSGKGVGGHPGLTTTIEARPEDAGIAAARVTLPASVGLDRGRLARACRPPSNAWSSCPRQSIVGHAVAWTPLAAQPLEGPVRLLSSAYALPELAISLGGDVPLELVARMRRQRGSVQLSLAGLPDVRFTRLAISVGGGRRSFFVSRRALCAHPRLVRSSFAAYNGMVAHRRSALRIGCQREE